MWSPGVNYSWKKPKLKNRNTVFSNFLKLDTSKGRAGQEFSFMCDIRGTTGSGKSVFALTLINELVRNNPNRWIAYYRADESQVKNLNQISPPYLQGKFQAIDHIVEIGEKDGYPPYEFIFYIDEAGLDASAKEALKREMRPLVKMAKKSRHYKAIVIMLDQTNSILKDYRAMCHFHFYKRISDDYIEEYKDWFAKKHKKKLLYLEDWEIGFRSNYKYFRDPHSKSQKNNFIRSGMLSMKMEDYIPWYIKEIEEVSQYLKNENVDHDYALYEKIKNKINEYSKIVQKEFGMGLKKSKMKNIMKAWLESKYPTDFYTLEKYMGKIYDNALLISYLKDIGEGEEEEPEEHNIIKPKTLFENGMGFPEYARVNLPKKDQVNEIFYLLLQGNTQRDIAAVLGPGKSKINMIVKEYNEKEIGYLFEDWFSFSHGGGNVAHNSNDPDYIHPETKEVYSLKYRYNREKTLTFYQEHDFRPEYKFIRGNIKQKKDPEFYYVALYNPMWIHKLQIQKVSPVKDDDKIVFKNVKDLPKIKIDHVDSVVQNA